MHRLIAPVRVPRRGVTAWTPPGADQAGGLRAPLRRRPPRPAGALLDRPDVVQQRGRRRRHRLTERDGPPSPCPAACAAEARRLSRCRPARSRTSRARRRRRVERGRVRLVVQAPVHLEGTVEQDGLGHGVGVGPVRRPAVVGRRSSTGAVDRDRVLAPASRRHRSDSAGRPGVPVRGQGQPGGRAVLEAAGARAAVAIRSRPQVVGALAAAGLVEPSQQRGLDHAEGRVGGRRLRADPSGVGPEGVAEAAPAARPGPRRSAGR